MFQRFPQIGQFKNFVRELKHVREIDPENAKDTYHLTGTVKLHGTHADILVTKDEYGEYQFNYQSRNRLLSAGFDNMGCFAFLNNVPREDMITMVKQIEEIYGCDDIYRHPFIISGEFCGGNIQKNVALCELPQMFVIYGIKIMDQWQPIREYIHVELEDHHIYNIGWGNVHGVEIDAKNPQAIVSLLQGITLDVENECPFAKKFDVSGVGEGMVWTCDEFLNDHRFWFKVKGDKHTVSNVTTLKDVSDEMKEKLKNCDTFAENAVTEARLNQGIEYLIEMRLFLTIGNFPQFLKWITDDTFNEEQDAMKEIGVNVKLLNKSIAKRAITWYKQYLKNMNEGLQEYCRLNVPALVDMGTHVQGLPSELRQPSDTTVVSRLTQLDVGKHVHGISYAQSATEPVLSTSTRQELVDMIMNGLTQLDIASMPSACFDESKSE